LILKIVLSPLAPMLGASRAVHCGVRVFFWLSKTADILVSPLFVSLLLALAAAFFARRSQARRAWQCGMAAFSLLYVLGSPFVAGHLLTYVEQYDGTDFRPTEKYDAVIVLGGFAGWDADGRPALSEGGERLLRGYELLSSTQARLGIIAAGGASPPPVEADVAADLLVQWGIERQRLLLGRTSINTHQNALEIKDIVQRNKLRRLLLVTSAFHMERALECMRAVGLEPHVLACDYHGYTGVRLFDVFAPRGSSLSESELALRELFGRLVYRVMGYAKLRSTTRGSPDAGSQP
jgi:uncharacterized SAM-binding protein YcdF (DUF218 family)